MPNVEAFYFGDHVGYGGGAGVAQEHGVLGFVAHGGGYLFIVPGADVDYDVGRIVPVEDARVGTGFIPGAPAQKRSLRIVTFHNPTNGLMGEYVLGVAVFAVGAVGDDDIRL